MPSRFLPDSQLFSSVIPAVEDDIQVMLGIYSIQRQRYVNNRPTMFLHVFAEEYLKQFYSRSHVVSFLQVEAAMASLGVGTGTELLISSSINIEGRYRIL